MIQDSEKCLEDLLQIHQSQGYLTITDIFFCVDKTSLPIDEVDRLLEGVISAGIILLDESPSVSTENSGQPQYDKSRLDYNQIYDRVAKIDNSLAGYVEKLRQILPPRHLEEFHLIHPAKEGNIVARERVIIMYLKVALRIALWYHNKYDIPLDETIQDANVGLILALEKIQLHDHPRYSLYATWWVRQNIERNAQGISYTFYSFPALIKQKLLVVVSLYKKQKSYTSGELCNDLIEEICDELLLDKKTANYFLEIVSDSISVDQLIGNGHDEIFSDDGQGIEEIEEKIQKESFINMVFDLLNDRERMVLAYRYGLIDGEDHTLENIGIKLGVTRERVRQIEAKAFDKIRRIKKLEFSQ